MPASESMLSCISLLSFSSNCRITDELWNIKSALYLYSTSAPSDSNTDYRHFAKLWTLGEIQLKMSPNRKLLFFLVVSVSSLTELLAQSQSSMPATQAIQSVSAEWRKDSSSCLGLRIKIYEAVLNSKPDSLNKDKLFRELGKPNKIQRFYSGATRKNYVEYIYYVYKDQCPMISLEGYAVGFVFDEDETILIEIVDHEYCG